MKKYVNGKYVELTADEVAAMDAERIRLEQEAANREPTPEERIAELEAALALLLSGEVE